MLDYGWNAVSNGKKKYNSDEFLRVRPDCELKVRLLGKPVKVAKIFSEDRKCAVLDNEEIGKNLKAKFPDILSNVSIRYACWCINREDNSLKILDMPYSVAKAFGNRVALVGSKISGSQEGCDWKIITNGKKGKDVRYEAVYIEETPLSQEEIEMVKDRKSEEKKHFDLTKIFKSCGFEEAEEKLLGS